MLAERVQKSKNCWRLRRDEYVGKCCILSQFSHMPVSPWEFLFPYRKVSWPQGEAEHSSDVDSENRMPTPDGALRDGWWLTGHWWLFTGDSHLWLVVLSNSASHRPGLERPMGLLNHHSTEPHHSLQLWVRKDSRVPVHTSQGWASQTQAWICTCRNLSWKSSTHFFPLSSGTSDSFGEPTSLQLRVGPYHRPDHASFFRNVGDVETLD